MDPGIWVGLLTLIVLEIVLGIDNLVFIAILADKLPPEQRDKARILGLSLALIMRLGLLFAISWLVTLTKPLITVFNLTFSGRDLILLFGGLFLLYKAVSELHERMEGKIEGMQNLEVGINFSTEERAFDLVLFCDFENKEGLSFYATHPVHTTIVAYLKSINTVTKAVDYEF